MVTPILSGFSASMCSAFTFDAAHACYLPLFTIFFCSFCCCCRCWFCIRHFDMFLWKNWNSLLHGTDYYFHFRFQILFLNRFPLTRFFFTRQKKEFICTLLWWILYLYVYLKFTYLLLAILLQNTVCCTFLTSFSHATFTVARPMHFLINLNRWWTFAGGIRDHGAVMVTVMDWATASMPDSIPTAPPTDQWAFDGICREHDFLDLLAHSV